MMIVLGAMEAGEDQRQGELWTMPVKASPHLQGLLLGRTGLHTQAARHRGCHHRCQMLHHRRHQVVEARIVQYAGRMFVGPWSSTRLAARHVWNGRPSAKGLALEPAQRQADQTGCHAFTYTYNYEYVRVYIHII